MKQWESVLLDSFWAGVLARNLVISKLRGLKLLPCRLIFPLAAGLGWMCCKPLTNGLLHFEEDCEWQTWLQKGSWFESQGRIFVEDSLAQESCLAEESAMCRFSQLFWSQRTPGVSSAAAALYPGACWIHPEFELTALVVKEGSFYPPLGASWDASRAWCLPRSYWHVWR